MATDILLAAVMGAHGLKGEVKVKIFTAAPEALRAYGPLQDAAGKSFAITALRSAKPGEAVVSFSGITSREGAEALKGTELFIAREKLPDADEEEFYHADLIGLEAWDADGRVLGKVSGIHNFGAGDVIEITRGSSSGSPGGDTVLLAFTRETVPHIEIAQGHVKGHIVVAVLEEDEADGAHPGVE